MIDQDLIKDAEIRMKKCLHTFQKTINSFRTGVASTNMLDNIIIEYYGTKTCLNQIANITIENSNIIKINVFDKNIVNIIEKKISESKLEISPVVDGNIIRLHIPSLTEERRINLSKVVRIESEKSKIQVRNIRRDINDTIKKNIKKKILNIDSKYSLISKIQLLTDSYIKQIDNLFIQKENEIMNF